MSLYIWIWVGIIIASVIIEVLTAGLVSIWFVPGAFVAGVLSLFEKVPLAVQVAVFIVISFVGIFAFRSFFSKKTQETKTNIDAIVGEKCIVTEKIDNYAGCGQAKVKGQYWSARSVSDEETFEVGEVLYVVAIEGVKLICKKK